MRVGVDLDGVMADFDKAWIDRWNADHGMTLEYKQCDHWDSLVTLTGVTYDEWWGWAESKHSDLFLEADALPGAVKAVRTLAEDGHEICIVTAKPRWAAGHPSTWLQKHDVPYDEIHVTSKKWYVGVDVLIDDADHNIRDVLERTDYTHAIHMRLWPYLQHGPMKEYTDNYRYHYAKTWTDALDVVRNMDWVYG